MNLKYRHAKQQDLPALITLLAADALACIIHEDSAPRVIIAKQVGRSPEKRGLPRDEGDRVRCDATMASGVE